MIEFHNGDSGRIPSHDELLVEVQEKLGWLESAAQEIGGPNATPESVFTPLNSDNRSQAPDPNWNQRQQAVARELAQHLGYGSEYNVISGLQGGVRLLEAGKIWKVLAETDVLDQENNVSMLVFAGSPYVPLGADERDFIERRGHDHIVGATNQYEATLAVARQLVETPDEQVASYGYELSESNAVKFEPTGQFMRLGKAENGQDVVMIRVDREEFTDDGNQDRYRYQPSQQRLMTMLSEILRHAGDTDSPIGLITSNAYASRQFDTIRAGLTDGRRYGVAMYGRETLAHMKGEPVAPATPLNQLPGELWLAYNKLRLLESDLSR